MSLRTQRDSGSYTPQWQPTIASALYNVYAVKTSKEKTPSVARRCFPNALKGRKGEKEMGILNFQIGLGPRVQRRENVGGSLNP